MNIYVYFTACVLKTFNEPPGVGCHKKNISFCCDIIVVVLSVFGAWSVLQLWLILAWSLFRVHGG